MYPTLQPAAVAVDATAPPTVHALYTSWSAAECGAPDGWSTPFWTGDVSCPDCRTAVKAALGVSPAVTR